MPEQHEWWQKGIIYQIYPRSFMDSNGDGIGDLAGIRSRLDYLQWLGVDAVWISPFYPSPMADFGYDISDYCNIDAQFGTLKDFDELMDDVHRRGLKLVLDFVPNHTSVEHAWFKESRSSRDNPKRNWYLWRDPVPGGGPPNNWLSNFGGSAWELDEKTGQYYYHAFLKEQPDLNWRNPEVRHAMHDVLRFWLDRGVDGFRVDVIWHIVKDAHFRDNPRNPEYRPGQNPYRELLDVYNADQPDVHEVIAEMRQVVERYPGRMIVGEIYLPVEKLVTYYGVGGAGVHMPFNFQLISANWNAHTVATAVHDYEAQLPPYGWPNWVLGNHDKPRLASRIGHRQARVAAMLLLTLRGTPTLYYGDELGMHDVHIPPDRVQDPFERNVPEMGLGRDPQRTPMQWDEKESAGFTTATARPWLPLADNAAHSNVAAQRRDPRSFLCLYHRLIELRRSQPSLAVGQYQQVLVDGDVYAYARWHRHHRPFLVVLNMDGHVREVELPGGHRHTPSESSRVMLSTHMDRQDEPIGRRMQLRPDEGLIIGL